MARIPLIDSPCPLSRAEQLRIDGHCGRCNKQVHVLDGLDDAGRQALFAAARGPLCVSYRVTSHRAPVLGAAMAAMLSAGTAMAGQDCDEARPELQSIDPAPAPVVLLEEADSEPLDTIIMVGGIQSAEEATWIDDSDLPDLPFAIETESEQAVVDSRALSEASKPR